ncbi:glycosyltransferase family 4 protein [Actinokineospora sp. NPDC004072]
MTTAHILTDAFPPQPGGLQAWTRDLATALTRAGVCPIVYVLGNQDGVARQPFEVVDVGELRTPWEAPLLAARANPLRLDQERSRLTTACTLAAVAKRRGGGAEVIVSTFVTTAGFTAHLVADALGIPHVAAIAGSDFTRDFRGRLDRQVFLEVCGAARVVVARNAEHVSALDRHLPGTPHRLIETSVAIPPGRWAKHAGDGITVFSDTGFDFKKGTGVLMDAFAALRSSGLPVRLVICGGDQPGQEGYWRERRRLLHVQCGPAVAFPGHLDRAEVTAHLGAADIYASASLGEGSSAARARALCLGIPAALTACGELTTDPGASHVRLAPVADADAFRDVLRALAADLLSGALAVDEEAVAAFRRRFDPRTEWSAWVSLLHEVGAPRR